MRIWLPSHSSHSLFPHPHSPTEWLLPCCDAARMLSEDAFILDFLTSRTMRRHYPDSGITLTNARKLTKTPLLYYLSWPQAQVQRKHNTMHQLNFSRGVLLSAPRRLQCKPAYNSTTFFLLIPRISFLPFYVNQTYTISALTAVIS